MHVVLDREDEARRLLIFGTAVGLPAAVEPNWRVERRHLAQQDVRELVLEGLCVGVRREVGALTPPAGDRAGDAADHLLDRALAGGVAELPTEVLLGDDVGRVLRPALGKLDVALLEGDTVAVADARVAPLPLDGVERMAPPGREIATDRQPAARS